MNQEDLGLLLRNSLNNPASEDQIPHIAEIVSNSNKSACRSFVRRLKRILKSPNCKPSFKLYTLKIIQACANTENISFIVYLYKKLLSKLVYLAEFQKESSEIYRGELLFGATSQEQRIASAEFLILFLQCIENWAERFGKDTSGNPTEFEEIYLSLKEKGVVFPPVNYIIEMPKEIKKEVHRCKRVIRTVMSMEENNVDCQAIKNDILELKKFKTYFVNEAAGFIEKGMEKYIQDLYEIIDKISIVIHDYKERKNRGKVVHKEEVKVKEDLIPLNILGIRLTNEINDALPKSIPRVDSPVDYLFDDLEQQEMSFVRSEINVSFDQESPQEDWSQINNEYCNVKDKLAEYEDLIQSYSNDLLKLQEKYLEAVEEREEIKLRIGSIINENVELHNENNSLMEKIKALEGDNFSKKEEIDAYQSQNHFLKCTLKALQEESLKSDKQIVKYLKQIDHLEDINKSLTKDNEKLQAELIKIHKIDQEFKLKITPAKFISPEKQGSFKERSQSCERLGNQVEKEFYKPKLPMRKNTMKEQQESEEFDKIIEKAMEKDEISLRNIINKSPELEEEEEKKQEPNESTRPKLKWKNEEKEKQNIFEGKLNGDAEENGYKENILDIGNNLGSVSDG